MPYSGNLLLHTGKKKMLTRFSNESNSWRELMYFIFYVTSYWHQLDMIRTHLQPLDVKNDPIQ